MNDIERINLTRVDLRLLLTSPDYSLEIDGTGNNTITVYLSTRNIRTLLSKLDRKFAGQSTRCTILKNDTIHPIYPCSSRVAVAASEFNIAGYCSAKIIHVVDEKYYADRSPGSVDPLDDPDIGPNS